MRLRLVAALAAALAASALAAPAPAAPAAVRWVTEQAYVPTPDGEMYVQFSRPDRGRAPVLLRMTTSGTPDVSPVLDVVSPGSYDPWEDHFRARGYVTAEGHILGTGRSGGCWDLGGPRQAAATAALVEWLGTRRWSNGRVALVGDWGVLDTATLAPRHLAAAVPVNGVSSWYHQAYDQAVPKLTADNEDFTVVHAASLSIDGTAAHELVPRSDPFTGPADPVRDVAEADLCDAAAEVLRAHAAPAYDAFWRERDWTLRAGDVRVPVLMEAGWRDVTANATQFTRYWGGLRRAADRRAIVGQWDYQDTYPGGMPLDPESNFPIWPTRYLELFLDRYLKGVRDPLLDRVPKVLTESSDQVFRSTLPLDAPRASYRLAEPLPGGSRTFVNTGTQTSRVFKRNPAAQAGFVSYGFPVERDTRLTGSAEAVLRLSSTLPRGQVAVTLLDLAPGATEGTPVARGLLDLRFRNSLAAPEDVPVATAFTARVALRPTDYVLRRGHRLVVAVAGCDVVWGVPDPVAGQVLTVHPESVLRLPVADPARGVV